MTENHKDIAVTADRAASTTRTRSEWRRPEYRKLEARDAETTVAGTNTDIVFS